MPTNVVQPPGENQLPIIRVIMDAMNVIGDNLPFGHGLRSANNHRKKPGLGDIEKNSPRAWLHEIKIRFRISGIELIDIYGCEIDFIKQGPLNSSDLEQSIILEQMRQLLHGFVKQLIRHPNIKTATFAELDAIERRHYLDQNTFGWTLFFETELEGC